MRIAIDAHAVGTGLAGNETYITNLIEALGELDTPHEFTLYVTKREAVERYQERWANFTVRRTLPHSPVVRVPLTLEAELRRRPVDLLHVQFTAPPFAPCPVVATIHDLSFEHLPETFNRRSWMQMRLTIRRTARRATHLITPSEYSRRDLVETYGIAPEDVTVTPLAPAPDFHPVNDENRLRRVRAHYGISGNCILALGAIQPRKNLVRLIKAYSILRRARPEANLPQLVIVGKRAWLYAETLRAVEESGARDSIKLLGYVSEEDLPALYGGALCFVYPSYFEGFGLPPLEAMACGTPVIAGDRTSLPEVIGDAGILVNPFDENELAQAIARVIDDAAVRARLRVKGIARAQQFSWRATAQKTLEAYERAAAAQERSDVNRATKSKRRFLSVR